MIRVLPLLRISVETGARKVYKRERVQPPRCSSCNRIPWTCPTCSDFCCACPVPFLAQRTKKNHRIMPRTHYDYNGRPYGVQFIDGYLHEQYASEEEDVLWLIESSAT